MTPEGYYCLTMLSVQPGSGLDDNPDVHDIGGSE